MPNASERRNPQDLLRDVDRARRVLSECGRALVRATDEMQFLQEMCSIAVNSAGYSLAWVGFARQDAARTVEPVVSYPEHDSHLASARISWADDEFGQGPAGKAIRSGLPQVLHNLRTANVGSWRMRALAQGHESVAALPIRDSSGVIGVFDIFAPEPDAFGPLEMELLEGVALEIAFGIETLRRRKEHERVEAALKTSQRLFRATFDQAPLGIAHVDLHGRIVLANARLEEILGYAPGEMAGLTVRELSYPDDIGVTDETRARLRAGDIDSFTMQKRYLQKSGGSVWISLTVSLMRAENGTPLFDIAVFEAIDLRVRAESLQRLQQTITLELVAADSEQAALRAAIRAICEAEQWECGRYFLPDENGERLRFAGAWGIADASVQAFLTEQENVTFGAGVGLMGIAWQTEKPVWVSDITTDPRVVQGAYARKHGMRGSFIFPVRSDGRVTGVLLFNSREVRAPETRLLDAVEIIGNQIGQFLQRKRAEEVQRRFRIAMDTSADIITLVDPQTMRYIDVNTTACEMQGYTREELLQMGPHDVGTLSKEEFRATYAETIASGKTSRLQSYHRRNDGSTFPIEVLRRAVLSDGRWIIVAILRDISDRVEAEKKLRESEARFRSLAELSSDSFWETDTAHRFTKIINGAAFRGVYQPHEQLGKTRWDLPTLTPDAGGWARLRETMDRHERFQDFEFSRQNQQGRVLHRSVSGEPVFDENGAFTGYHGVARDITARKTAELRLLELNAELEARVAQRTTDLERANKELEAFSYSVAHDLRAPLRAISGFSAIVLEENENRLEAASVRYLRRIKAGGEYMGELVDDLLDLARISRQEMRRGDVNLGAVAHKVMAALAEAHPQRAVETEVKAHMRADCDPGLIEIVMSNLIGNAWKFTAKTANARIEVGVKRRGSQSVYFVRDNGAGFDMQYVKNLFAPFQRLHRRDDFEGTGIGLSLVKRIIDKHGGRVWAEGERGKGASFYFTLD